MRAGRSARAQTTPDVADTSPDCRPCVSAGRSAARLNDGVKIPPLVAVAAAVTLLTKERRERFWLSFMAGLQALPARISDFHDRAATGRPYRCPDQGKFHAPRAYEARDGDRIAPNDKFV